MVGENSNEHLKKTLNLKNNQINQLLNELKQTQQLCSNLKANYLNEEQKFKQKIRNLQYSVEQSKKQYRQIYEEYNQVNRNSIQNQVKMNGMIEQWDNTLSVINRKVHSLESENQRLKVKLKQLQSNLKIQTQQSIQLRQKIDEKQKKIIQTLFSCSELQKKHRQKQLEWEKWKQQILQTLDIIQKKRNEKKKMGNKLDALQDKIKTIITNI